MLCINFCDILSRSVLKSGAVKDIIGNTERRNYTQISRIYVGSSFCSQYFKRMDFLDLLIPLCKEYDLHITLCLPIVSEKDLMKVKQMLHTWMDSTNLIDEITVNDFGMLDFISQSFSCKINLGRLFIKDARDIRVKEYFASCIQPSILSFDLHRLGISGIEIDPISQRLNIESDNLEGITICVHSPYCYLTTGNICKYASIHKSPEKKFRPNIECAIECNKICESYHEEKEAHSFDIIRVGRGVYFHNPNIEITGRVDRTLFFPVADILWKTT